MKPVMCDLFSGRGGWTKGFQAHGWHCIGIDLYPQPDYPGEEFIQADIAHLIELPPADFYCCSSPCEQFSVHGMKHFHPNPKWPWLGISLFERAKELIEATGKPYAMENVRAAQGFIGKSDYHCGPFYLWGPGLPWFWSPSVKLVTKKSAGFRALPGAERVRILNAGLDLKVERMKWQHKQESMAGGRKGCTAQAAEIPEVISSHVALMAGSR